MSFLVHVSQRAQRSLKGFPARDRERILSAIETMEVDPLAGDVVKLKGQEVFRRRVGNYRIIFAIDFKQQAVGILDVLRRTSTTYR